MKDLTELVCIIDRSGSMMSIRNDAIGGFNAFIDAQQAIPGDARLTLVLFDHEYELQLEGVALTLVNHLTTETYQPRGTTALLDAVGRTLDDIGKRLAAAPEDERPNKVLVCILTDGMENASKDYSRERVRAMVEHQQQKYGWEFQFLAANQDAFAEAGSLGIASQDAASFAQDAAGTSIAFLRMSERSRATRLRI